MNHYEEMEDMIEIENIKQESHIKEELDLSCNEDFDCFSNDEFSNNDLPQKHDFENTRTKETSLGAGNQSQNNNEDQSFLPLKKNPFCNIQISNISYTSKPKNTKTTPLLSKTELADSFPENEVDKILFQCERCSDPKGDLVKLDHTYTKPCNRLKQVTEKEEKKDAGDQIYNCKFCPFVLSSPHKYLLHLQTHGSEISSCRSCKGQLKMSDSLNAHILIKLRSCEICRKVFTHYRGYRQHLHSHYKDKDTIKKNPETYLRNEKVSQSKEDNENITVIAEERETYLKNKKIPEEAEKTGEKEDHDDDEEEEEEEEDEDEEDEEEEEENTGYIEEGLETYQKSFSDYVKNWKNDDNEINGMEKNKKAPVSNQRREFHKPTSSNDIHHESQEVETLEIGSQSSLSHISDSVENIVPLHEIEKVIFLFECTGCARNFVSRKAILEHVTEKHTDEYRMWESLYKIKKLLDKKPTQTMEDKYTCRFCPVKFNTISNYMTHLREHHLCIHCDKIFRNQGTLEDHKRQLQESLICQVCDMPFLLKCNFLAHLKSHENDCEICQEQFVSEAMLLVHRKVTHPEGICYVCHKWFSSEELLKTHKLKMHNISLKTFSCWICLKRYRSEVSFRFHMATHGEKRPFSCPHCGKFYARYAAMTTHSESCSLFDERKIFECDICKVAFYDGKKFVSHMKKHFESNRMKLMSANDFKDQKILKDDKELNKTKDVKTSQDLKNTKDLKNITDLKTTKVPKNTKVSRTTKDLNNKVDLKNIVTSTKTLFNSGNNLKPLSFGPKIFWRESSFPTKHVDKLEKARQRKLLRKDESEKMKCFIKKSSVPPKKSVPPSKINSTTDAVPTNKSGKKKLNTTIRNEIISNSLSKLNEQNLEEGKNQVKTSSRSIFKPKSSSEMFRKKLELTRHYETVSNGAKVQSSNCMLEEDPLKITDSQKNLLLVVRKRQGKRTLQEEPVEKLLLLKPINKGKVEKNAKKGVEIAIMSTYPNFKTKTKLVDPLTLECSNDSVDKMINSPLNGESDPLALENSLIDSETQMETSPPAICESDPLALENSSVDSTTKMDFIMQMETSPVICETDPLALDNPPVDFTDKMDFITKKKSSSKMQSKILNSQVSKALLISQETNNLEKSSTNTLNENVLELRPDQRDKFLVRNFRLSVHANRSAAQEKKKAEPGKKNEKLRDARLVKNIEINSDFFFCTICKTRIPSSLKVQHMKIHDEGLKMFKCNTCNKKFNTYVGKIRHEKSHTKEVVK